MKFQSIWFLVFSSALSTHTLAAPKIEPVIQGLESPWGMTFLPDGRALITERKGEIRIFKDGKLQDEKITNVPKVHAKGQGGLLDIQAHPDFKKNSLIYFTFVKPDSSGGGGTVLARAKLDGNALTEVTEIFRAEPTSSSTIHFGSRIAFDDKGYVFVTTGERGSKPNAQNLSNHLGKVIRVHADGKVPTDNPFVKTEGAKPEIWSYGHRNVQGLYFDREKKVLYAHEHGARGGDELNRIEKGKNYGWPEITHGIDYDGSVISAHKEKAGMEQPLHQWTPSIAPCGMVRVKSARYPGWKDSFLVGALAHQFLSRVELNKKDQFVREEKLFRDIGRVRFVTESPDGWIYFGTEFPGKVFRILKP